MLISKNNPAIQESSGLPSTVHSATHRISELPSLRYGSVGSKTTMRGPLMVSSLEEEFARTNGMSRRKKSIGRIVRGGRRSDDSGEERDEEILRAERRVRFLLPPPDVSYRTDVEDASKSDADADFAPTRGVVVNNHHSFLKLKTFGGFSSSDRSNIVLKPATQNPEKLVRSSLKTGNKSRGNCVENRFKNCLKSSRQKNVEITSRKISEIDNFYYNKNLNYRGNLPIKPDTNYLKFDDVYNQNNTRSLKSKKDLKNKTLQHKKSFISYFSHNSLVNRDKQSDLVVEKCLEQQNLPEDFFHKYRERYADKYDSLDSKTFILGRHFGDYKKDFQKRVGVEVPVAVAYSPGVRNRVHPTGRYIKGTLSPTQNTDPSAPPCSPGGQALLRAAQNGDDEILRDHLRRGLALGIPEADLNAVDCSGRTVLSYIASNGFIDSLEIILQIPGLDPNRPDNEGNTPLHFAAQAGQVECLNCLLSRCRGVEIDARNNLGFTSLMKAALQGRNKCAKLLLFAGANPTLRDNGRGFRADQWARFCGRYVTADVIEKHARQRLLERSTSYGSWGMEHEMGATVVNGKVIPVPPVSSPPSNGIKSKLRKVFRTSSGPSTDQYSSARLVTQLTSAALCASSPVLPSTGSVPPMVKSLIRPLTVPRLQITLVNNNGDYPNNNFDEEDLEEPCGKTTHSNGASKVGNDTVTNASKVGNGSVVNKEMPKEPIKPERTKKKK